jgi:streptogramin lyase
MLQIIYTLILGLSFTNVVLSQNYTTPKSNNAVLNNTEPDIIFDHLTEKDGLSSENVTDMLRDKDGFLWISTSLGLNRYDGQRFEVFQHNQKDSTTILNNLITAICQDPKGNIWGTTEDGIFCYQKSTGTFRNYRTWDKSIYPRLNAITCDQKGVIWAGSEYGLVKLDANSGKFDYFRHEANNPCSMTSDQISKNGIARDPFGSGLWLATRNGLNFFDFTNEDFTNVQNMPDTTIFNNHRISALHTGKNDIIWMFDDLTGEIIGMEAKNKKIKHRIDMRARLKKPYMGNIFETSDGQLWYSSNSFETIRIDLNNNYQSEIIRNSISDPSSIIGDYVSSAFEDTDHSLWLGTTAGISRFNPSRMFYRIIRLSDRYPELDNNWHITCITQNPENGEWWIGSRDGKVYVYNPASGQSRRIDFIKLAKGQGFPTFIVDIEFHEDLALICSIDQPTFQYEIKSNKLQKFYGLTGKYKDYKKRVFSFETDSTFILGNNYDKILRWNFKNNTIREINFICAEDRDGLTYSAGWLNGYKDKGTWMSAQNSAAGYIHPGDSLIYTVDMNIGMKVGKGGYFNSLGPDIHGNMFFTYISRGLFRLKKRIEKVESINDVEITFWDISNGLISENLQSSTSDHDGNIWCASFNKFSVVYPENKSVYSFKINLSENNSFFYNYFIPLSNGHMLTNIKGNLVEFFPERMKREYPASNPLISSIKLPAKSIYLSDEKEISLQPDENFISIRFGCLSMEKYYPYAYQYKMDGVNEDWVEYDGAAEAVYSNLPPGKYIFNLRTISNDRKWQSGVKELKIIIKTPFYKSWWFISFICLVISYITFYTARTRIKNIRNIEDLKSKAQLLEKEKTAVMYENLKQHLNPHFLFNSLTSLSSLIRIDQRQAGDFLDKMSKVYRYILKNKDNETVPLIDELKFVDIYNQLQKTRFGDGLHISVNISEEYHHRKIAPVTLQNLVENAIKHNIADEETPLLINIYIDDDYLVVQNNLQTKGFVETSNKQGQHSMISLYKYLSPRPVIITESEDFYTVKIPLI